MRRIGTAVFIFGVILASLYAAPTPPKWVPFLLGLAITVGGGLMARSKVKVKKSASGESAEGMDMTPESLREAIDALTADVIALAAAGAEAFDKDPDAHQARIEGLQTSLNHMIDGRYAIQAELGMQPFAEIFSQLAAVERALQRAWSTLVDGYPLETVASLQEAAGILPRTAETVAKFD